MILKSENIRLYNKKIEYGTPINLKLHWCNKTKEYVLCKQNLSGYIHFTIEEVEDMLRILKKANREIKNDNKR